MNFLLDSKAVEITGMGDLTYHGSKNPHKYEGTRCHECEHKDVCPDFFAYDKELFTSDEMYTPDLCIWSPDIDIEDNYAAVIKFESGVLCTYSICAHSQYEGEVIIIEGETGRLEARNVYFRDINDQSNTHDTNIITQQTLTLCRFGKGKPEAVEVPKGVGSHGGADLGIFGKIFSTPPDPNIPTLEDGIQAVLIGAALVESIKQGGNVVKVQEMI
jgi:predicted dehydrogenase